jgi:hypothetical protein
VRFENGAVVAESDPVIVAGPVFRQPVDDMQRTAAHQRWLLHLPQRSGGFAGTLRITNRHPNQTAEITLWGFSDAGTFVTAENVTTPEGETQYLEIYGDQGIFKDFADQISHLAISDNVGGQSRVALKYTGLSSRFGAWTEEINLDTGDVTGQILEMEARDAEAYVDGIAVLNLASFNNPAEVFVVQRDLQDNPLAEVRLGELAPGAKVLSVVSNLFEFREGSKYTIECRNGVPIQALGITFFQDTFFAISPIFK